MEGSWGSLAQHPHHKRTKHTPTHKAVVVSARAVQSGEKEQTVQEEAGGGSTGEQPPGISLGRKRERLSDSHSLRLPGDPNASVPGQPSSHPEDATLRQRKAVLSLSLWPQGHSGCKQGYGQGNTETTFPWGIARDAQEQTKEAFLWGGGRGEVEEGCMKTPELDQVFKTGWEVPHGAGGGVVGKLESIKDGRSSLSAGGKCTEQGEPCGCKDPPGGGGGSLKGRETKGCEPSLAGVILQQQH